MEMAEILQLQVDQATTRLPPKRIKRPCDYGLELAIINMETQVGTVESYNRLCDAAAAVKAKIDAGMGKPAMVHFATDPKFIYPRA